MSKQSKGETLKRSGISQSKSDNENRQAKARHETSRKKQDLTLNTIGVVRRGSLMVHIRETLGNLSQMPMLIIRKSGSIP